MENAFDYFDYCKDEEPQFTKEEMTSSLESRRVIFDKDEHERIRKILKYDAIRFGKWVVTKENDLIFTGEDRGGGTYIITRDRLTEKDWISHLRSKGWIDFNEFIYAYWCVLARLGVRTITIEVYFPYITDSITPVFLSDGD
jgi:dipeptidyl aminopeptidase/acylaminoacyl peptidase